MARVTHVAKARKDQGPCGRCHKEIKRGDSYKWVALKTGPRSSLTKRRCGSYKCNFRPSELTTSDKLSRVYGAYETAEDNVNDWKGEGIEDLTTAMTEAAEAIREVADEYQESADNMRAYFPDSAKADELEERCQELTDWADTIENVQLDEYGEDEDSPEAQTREEWIEEQQELARSALGECPC